MVDMQDLKSSALVREGSSPSIPTTTTVSYEIRWEDWEPILERDTLEDAVKDYKEWYEEYKHKWPNKIARCVKIETTISEMEI